MGKMKDLTGQTFGLLYVIERAEDVKPGRPAWHCQCECGNITTVTSTALLKTGGTKSCGCLRKKQSDSLIDLTGQTFGKLFVMYKDPDAKLIHTVHKIDEALFSLAGVSAGTQGTGGMITKLQAAKICMDSGCEMIIANGNRPENLYDIMDDMQIGTKFTGVMV